MKILIRKTTQSDVAAIYNLVCGLEEFIFPRNEFVAMFNKNNSNNNIGYFVAELDGQVIGFGSMYINDLLHHCSKVGEIQELVVSPENRGNNIGKLMVKEMIEWAFEQGAIQAEVTCNLVRENAHVFYQTIGFVHTHKKLVCKHV